MAISLAPSFSPSDNKVVWGGALGESLPTTLHLIPYITLSPELMLINKFSFLLVPLTLGITCLTILKLLNP